MTPRRPQASRGSLWHPGATRLFRRIGLGVWRPLQASEVAHRIYCKHAQYQILEVEGQAPLLPSNAAISKLWLISVHYPHNLSQTSGWQGNCNPLSRIRDTAGAAIIIEADWNMLPSRHLDSAELGGWTSDGNVTGRWMAAVGYRPQQQATDTVQRWE